MMELRSLKFIMQEVGRQAKQLILFLTLLKILRSSLHKKNLMFKQVLVLEQLKLTIRLRKKLKQLTHFQEVALEALERVVQVVVLEAIAAREQEVENLEKERKEQGCVFQIFAPNLRPQMMNMVIFLLN